MESDGWKSNKNQWNNRSKQCQHRTRILKEKKWIEGISHSMYALKQLQPPPHHKIQKLLRELNDTRRLLHNTKRGNENFKEQNKNEATHSSDNMDINLSVMEIIEELKLKDEEVASLQQINRNLEEGLCRKQVEIENVKKNLQEKLEACKKQLRKHERTRQDLEADKMTCLIELEKHKQCLHFLEKKYYTLLDEYNTECERLERDLLEENDRYEELKFRQHDHDKYVEELIRLVRDTEARMKTLKKSYENQQEQLRKCADNGNWIRPPNRDERVHYEAEMLEMHQRKHLRSAPSGTFNLPSLPPNNWSKDQTSVADNNLDNSYNNENEKGNKHIEKDDYYEYKKLFPPLTQQHKGVGILQNQGSSLSHVLNDTGEISAEKFLTQVKALLQ